MSASRNPSAISAAAAGCSIWKLYLIDPQYGSLGYDGYHRWEILEGRYTLAVMFEYAGTLGLLDLNYVHPTGARNDFQNNWGGDDLGALSRYDARGCLNRPGSDGGSTLEWRI